MKRPRPIGSVVAVEAALELPEWLPASVREFALIMYRGALAKRVPAETLQLLCSLTADPRMERVWRELTEMKSQCGQSTEAFSHQASLPDWLNPWAALARSHQHRASELRAMGGLESEQRAKLLEWEAGQYEKIRPHVTTQPIDPQTAIQGAALATFFNRAILLAVWPVQTVSSAEADTARRGYLETAAKLRADSAARNAQGRPDPAVRLLEAALDYEAMADEQAPPTGHPLRVERHREEPHLRGYVIALAEVSKEIFGSPLYGSIARVANVIFNRSDLTSDKVRELLRSRTPGVFERRKRQLKTT